MRPCFLHLLLLKDLDTQLQHKAASTAARQQQPITPSPQRDLEQHYSSLYDTLLEHGFEVQQVQPALAALHSSSTSPQGLSSHWASTTAAAGAAAGAGAAAVGLEAALDWLCLNVPPGQLPRRFIGSSTAHLAAGSEGVKVGAGVGPAWL